MRKVRFTRSGSTVKKIFPALSLGILAVGAISFIGYKASVGSLTKRLVPDVDIQNDPAVTLDLSQVDSILGGVEKPAADNDADTNAPADADLLQPTTKSIADELETLYYEQAKVMPVAGEVLNEFSWGELVKSAGGVWKTHDGIDIAAENGAEVKSMTSGTVLEIYSDPLWGNCIVIDHGKTVLGCYYGLSPDISVNIGDKVSAGQVIGTVGSTADIESDLASHLHFALKYEGSWIDPISYIEPMK